MLFSTNKGKNAADKDSVDLSSDPQTAASTNVAAGWQDLTISAGQSVQNSAAQAYAGNTPPANAQVDQLNYISSMQQSEPGMSAPASPVGPPDIWEETGVVQRPAAPAAQVQQPDAQVPYTVNAAVPATAPAVQQVVPPAPPQYAPTVSMPLPPAAPIQGYDLASAQLTGRADDQTLSASQAPLQRVDSVPNFSAQSTSASAALAPQSLVGILAQELGEVPSAPEVQQAAPVVLTPEPVAAPVPITPVEPGSVQIPIGEHDLDLSDSHTKARVVQAALQDVDAAIVKFGVDKAQIDEWTAIVRERMYTLFEVHEDEHAHVIELQRKVDSLHMILGTRDEELALLKQKIGE